MKSRTRQKKRNTTGRQLRHMLDERRELLAMLLRVSSLTHHGQDEPDADLLEEFCELVVDYIAAGHFGLYQRIAEGKERRNRVAMLATRVFPEIEGTTQVALAFSEKYKIDGQHDRPDKLERDLSELGVALTTRIELEDKLITAMLDTPKSTQIH
ncbi:MAG: Rsd/AlgQ family anti-sigma factor [Gammaproteobacteria bacterium]